MNRAGESKLQIKFENVEEKAEGLCLVAQLSLMPFECISTSISNFYKDTKGTIKTVYDEKRVHVETKLSVALITKMRVHLTLYYTNNKIIMQGSKAEVEWWKLNQLRKIIENCDILQFVLI